jgi:hypothetical protein
LDEELRLYFRYSACEFGWCFTCLDWHHLLCENWAGVVFRLDQMNTGAACVLACRNHSLMNAKAMHAAPAELR